MELLKGGFEEPDVKSVMNGATCIIESEILLWAAEGCDTQSSKNFAIRGHEVAERSITGPKDRAERSSANTSE